MRAGNVLPKSPRTKAELKKSVSTAWFRLQQKHGKGTLADAIGASCTKTVDNCVTGAPLPEAHFIFNALTLDPSALDEILALYGFRAAPLTETAANDMATIAGLSHVAGDWVQRLADGHRCYRDTLALAEAIRPLLTALTKIVVEADNLREAA